MSSSQAKKKTVEKAINFNQTKEILSLMKDMDKRLSDNNLNEKIGIIFRTMHYNLQNTSQRNIYMDLIEISADIMTHKQELVSGQDMQELIHDYSNYVHQKYPTLNYQNEIVYFYYPIDSRLNQSEISDEGKSISYSSRQDTDNAYYTRLSIQAEKRQLDAKIDKAYTSHEPKKFKI